MKKKVFLCLITTLISFAAAQAQQLFTASLDGSQEVGPNASPATGSGMFTLNANNTVTYDVTFSGLTGAFSAAHIHGPSAPAGVNAGVLFPLTLVGAGHLAGTTPAFTGVNLTSFLNGQTYANIHSSTFGNGEIRGQILAVPEPSTMALAGLGVAGLAWQFLRRRK